MFRKNIMGLWLIQECRRTWAEAGRAYEYTDLAEMAEKAEPFGAMVEVDHASFLQPGDMPARIADFCRETGQQPPEDHAAFARCVFESLALKYRWVLEKLEECLEMHADVIHIVGGGSRNRLLCRLTAGATGRPVLSGPDEASSSGNVLMQAMGRGLLDSAEEARDLIRRSFDLASYEPRDTERWDEHYCRFLEIKESSTTLL